MKPAKITIILLLFIGSAIAQPAVINTRLSQLGKSSASPKAQAATVIKLYGDVMKEIDPVSASTFLGFKGYEGRWPDMSLAARTRNRAWNQAILNAAQKIPKAGLSADDALNLGLIENSASQSIKLTDYNLDLMPVDQMNGIQLSYPMVIGATALYTTKDADNLLTLMSGISQSVDQVVGLLNEGLKNGMVPAKIAIEPVSAQIKGMIADKPEQSPFYSVFATANFTADSAVKHNYQQKAKTIITDKINPAYQKLLIYIQDMYYAKCRDNVSMASLPNGKEKYQFLINVHTSTNMQPDKIHELGLAEVKRIQAEMAALRDKSGFKGTEKEFNEFLRKDPQFFYTSAADLLQGYRDICKRIDPGLIKLFGKLPRLPYGVMPVPDYSAPSTTTAYYFYGSYKLGNPGYFFANTYDLKSRPKWEMEALALHEAVPGHHLQLSLQDEIEQPDFRKFLSVNAFTEGWGLYAESLGEQLGLYQDVYHKYGQLTFELWRAIRLVVDTGLHYYGWSREEAIKYFTDNSPRAPKDIQVEVDRYIAYPAQAVSYKIGQLKITELRNKSQQALGAKFNIRKFHDVVLSSGSIPLTLLEGNVNSWIASQK